MNNKISQAIQDFWTRNVVVQDPTWTTSYLVVAYNMMAVYNMPEKKSLWYFIDYLRWTVWALLTIDDVKKGMALKGPRKFTLCKDLDDPHYAFQHSFNFISDKEKVIQESVNEILKNIENDGFTKHINVEYYLQNHISPKVIEHTLLKYFKKIVMWMLEVVEIPILPLGVTAMNEVVELPDHQKEILWERYKDLDHDFLPWEQEILAYMLQRNRLDPITLSRINLALRRNWDDADYYISQYDNSDFLEKFISEKLLKTNNMAVKLNTNESSFQGMREYF